MNLPVRDLLGAHAVLRDRAGLSSAVARSDTPHQSAVLGRDQVQIGLAENGGDPHRTGVPSM